jgi:hypothetical protein
MQRTLPHRGSGVARHSPQPDLSQQSHGNRTAGMQTSLHSTSQQDLVSLPGDTVVMQTLLPHRAQMCAKGQRDPDGADPHPDAGPSHSAPSAATLYETTAATSAAAIVSGGSNRNAVMAASCLVCSPRASGSRSIPDAGDIDQSRTPS